jgi:hypothetical protein
MYPQMPRTLKTLDPFRSSPLAGDAVEEGDEGLVAVGIEEPGGDVGECGGADGSAKSGELVEVEAAPNWR